MLRRAQVNHILRAAAAVTSHNRFVMVGTGAVIAAAAKPIPAAMMMTSEVDLFADGAPDPDAISDLIDASIGAWREKDVDWLRAGLNAGVLSAERLRALVDGDMPAPAPDAGELANRLQLLAGERR